MATHWNVNLEGLRYPQRPSESNKTDDERADGEGAAQEAQRLFAEGLENVQQLAAALTEITDPSEQFAEAVGLALRDESAWSAYENAGVCAANDVPPESLEQLVTETPWRILRAPGVPPHLVDRAARHLLAVAQVVRINRLVELGAELTESERTILSNVGEASPWFADPDWHEQNPAASGYLLMFNPKTSAAWIRRDIEAIDEFLHPVELPDGYVTCVIQVKDGLIARAFVPADSAWVGSQEIAPHETVPWSTGSIDRPTCVVVRPLGLTDGSPGLDQPATGVPERLRRWGGEGMVVEAFPVWGLFSWKSADVHTSGFRGPMTEGQIHSLGRLEALLRIYANPSEATMVCLEDACYLGIRHASRGSLSMPILLAGSTPMDELLEIRSAWYREWGNHDTPVFKPPGSTNIDTLLTVPYAAHQLPDPPRSWLYGSALFTITGDSGIDWALHQGGGAARRTVFEDPKITTMDDIVNASETRLRSEPPDTVEAYAELVGFYTRLPLAIRKRLGAIQLLLAPPEAHAMQVAEFNARQALTDQPANGPAANQLQTLGDVGQVLQPSGIDEATLARMRLVHFDPAQGAMLRVWQGTSGARAKVFMGVSDPDESEPAGRMGEVSPALREILHAYPEVTIVESRNGPDRPEATLAMAAFYVHTHLAKPERISAVGRAAEIASRIYPDETVASLAPWETDLRRHLDNTHQRSYPGRPTRTVPLAPPNQHRSIPPDTPRVGRG